jgi:hypothetical protein
VHHDQEHVRLFVQVGYAELPLTSFSGLQSGIQELRLNAWDTKWRREAVPTSGLGTSAGIIGTIFLSIKPLMGQQQLQQQAATGTAVGGAGRESAMLAAGQASHMSQGAVGQVPLTNIQQTKVGTDMQKGEFTEAPGVHLGSRGATTGTTGQSGVSQTSKSSNVSQAGNMSQSSQMTGSGVSEAPGTGMFVTTSGLPGTSQTGLAQTSNIGSSGIQSSGIQSGSTGIQSGSTFSDSGLGKPSTLGSTGIQAGEPLTIQSGVVGVGQPGQVSSASYSGQTSSLRQSDISQTSGIASDKASSYAPSSQPVR